MQRIKELFKRFEPEKKGPVQPEPIAPEVVTLITVAAEAVETGHDIPLTIHSKSELLEQVEKKKPVDFFVVTADDEEEKRQTNANELQILFLDTPETKKDVSTAASVHDLVIHALRGNAGRPADVVLLDHAYTWGHEKWTLTEELVTQLGYELSIDVSHLQKREYTDEEFEKLRAEYEKLNIQLDRTRLSTSDLMPNELYSTQNSISFALLLRALGYIGKIFIVSSDPPFAQDVQNKTLKFGSGVPGCEGLAFPIDGFSQKRAHVDKILVGKGTVEDQDGTLKWNSDFIPGEYLSEAFRYLLR